MQPSRNLRHCIKVGQYLSMKSYWGRSFREGMRHCGREFPNSSLLINKMECLGIISALYRVTCERSDPIEFVHVFTAYDEWWNI